MNLIVNGHPRQFSSPTTVSRLLETLELRPVGIAVEINEQIVPRGEHAQRELKDGDRIEIMSLVGGG